MHLYVEGRQNQINIPVFFNICHLFWYVDKKISW